MSKGGINLRPLLLSDDKSVIEVITYSGSLSVSGDQVISGDLKWLLRSAEIRAVVHKVNYHWAGKTTMTWSIVMLKVKLCEVDDLKCVYIFCGVHWGKK